MWPSKAVFGEDGEDLPDPALFISLEKQSHLLLC